LRLNNTLRLPAITYRNTHGTQAALQGGIADREPLPNLVAQFLLGDHTIAMLDEIAEHLEHLRSQPGTLARPVQGMELRVQSTICKAVEHTSSAAQRRIATGMLDQAYPREYVAPRIYTSREWHVFTANSQECPG
jgi:hypothetical protein